MIALLFLLPLPNSTYLSNTKIVIPEPMSESTKGLLGLTSLLQFTDGPTATAGQAAFIQSGGQAFQNQASHYFESKATGFVTETGLDKPLGVGYYAYHIYKTQTLDLPIEHDTHLTLTPVSATISKTWRLP